MTNPTDLSPSFIDPDLLDDIGELRRELHATQGLARNQMQTLEKVYREMNAMQYALQNLMDFTASIIACFFAKNTDKMSGLIAEFIDKYVRRIEYVQDAPKFMQ